MTRYTYGFSRDIALPFAEAVKTVTAAIQAEGFMALPHMNSRANSNSQAADPHLVYTVLEICDPLLMERIIAVSPDLGLAFVCKAIIRGVAPDASTVCITDPYQFLGSSVQRDSRAASLIEELNSRLWSVYLHTVLTAAGFAF